MISAGAKCKLKQEEIKDLVATNYYKKYLQNFKYNELFVKKNGADGGGWEEGVEDILFSKPSWNFSFTYFTPGNSRQIKAITLETAQNCVTSPLEIQRVTIKTPGNST